MVAFEVKALKTCKIVPNVLNIFQVLDQYLRQMPEGSILAITSKIVAICEGRVIKIEGNVNKRNLVQKEADFYIPAEKNKYGHTITIKNSLLIPNAGIDESNGNGYYIFWPSDPQMWANKIRKYLKKRFALKKVGVIITDSKTTPLRWGTSGVCLSHAGFRALNDYIHTPDLFGRFLKVTKSNVADALAASAVLAMGEGNEQTPLALITDLPFVQFKKNNPSRKEIEALKISLDDDIYASLLKGVDWQKN